MVVFVLEGKELTFGFEGYHRHWNMMDYMNMGGMMSMNQSLPNVDTNLVGAFADYHHAFSDRLRLNGGLRFDHATISTGVPGLDNDLYFAYQNTRSTSHTDDYSSGNLRFSYSLPQQIEFFAGAGATGRVASAEERFLLNPCASHCIVRFVTDKQPAKSVNYFFVIGYI